MGVKFSIRYKFLSATTFLLAVCVGTYLLLASYIFKEDKSASVFDYNRSLVVNLSSDLENFMRGLMDKMELVAHFHKKADLQSLNVVRSILAKDKNLVWVGSSQNFQRLDRRIYLNEDFQKTYGLEDGFFEDRLVSEKPIPFDKVMKTGQAYWNATLSKGGPALIGVAKSVIEESEDGTPFNHFLVLAFVRTDRLLQALSETSPLEGMVVNREGEVLAHPDPATLRRGRVSKDAILDRAVASELKTQVLKYNSGADHFLGAFSKALGGELLVLSRVSEASAFGAVNDLTSRSLLFGSILVTFAFILAILFSRSLTQPIEVLMGGMEKVASGDLVSHIQVGSQDEIASLAGNFNHMIDDLRESKEELAELNQKVLENERTAAVAAVARGVAHEFGNLLMQITGKAEISRNKEPEKMRLALDRIVDASQRASEILDRFKHLSENQQVENPVTVENIKHVAEEAFDLLEHQLRTRGIQVVSELEPVEAQVKSTPLLQVFVNLMINASHAMETIEGSKTIYVSLRDVGERVSLVVRDTGPGVPEELMGQVTQAFFTTKGNKGTGLGLAICREIIEIDHQGEFRVSNHPEGGFQIQMSFPKRRVQDA